MRVHTYLPVKFMLKPGVSYLDSPNRRSIARWNFWGKIVWFVPPMPGMDISPMKSPAGNIIIWSAAFVERKIYHVLCSASASHPGRISQHSHLALLLGDDCPGSFRCHLTNEQIPG